MSRFEIPATAVAENIFTRLEVLNLTPRQSTVVMGPLLEFLAKHKPYVSQVLLGIADKPWDKNDVRQLESLLVREIADPVVVRDYLRVLRKATAFYMLRERRRLPLPRIPVLSAEPKNPFRNAAQRELQRFAAWKATLEKWIREDEAARKSEKETMAAGSIVPVIVSAILHGGMVNMASVLALVRAFPDLDRHVALTDGRLHLDLSLSWRGIPDMETRRWQPDALTAVLLLRTPAAAVEDLLAPVVMEKKPDETTNGNGIANTEEKQSSPPDDSVLGKRLARLLVDALQEIPADDRRLLGGIRTLLRASQTVAHLEMPGILASYATRHLICHSLQRKTLKRISKDKWIAQADRPPPKKRQRRTVQDLERTSDFPSEDLEYELVQTLRRSFHETDRDQVRKQLTELSSRNGVPAFVRWMADFGDSLVAVPTISGKLRSIGKARNLLLTVATRLGCFAENGDPSAISTESLETVYIQALESTDPVEEMMDNRPALAHALFEFHRYMMARHDKAPIEDQGLLAAANELARVDANLLTLEEYRAALQLIEASWPRTDAPARKRIARVLVILGFRCGLRRREALYMLVQDLLDGPAELLIRPSELRQLKSDNALRRLPLAALLTDEELQEVMEWKRERVDVQKAKSADCLFGSATEDLTVIPQSIFEQINAILAQVTGAPTMHYHHLRHSFATWTFLRLMLADCKEIPNFFPQLPETAAWLRQGPAFRRKLYGNALATRKHGYLVAGLLGHGSPATSMEHYVHLLDWLLAMYLEDSPAMCPDQKLVEAASGKSRNTLREWTKSGSSMAIALRLWKKRIATRSPGENKVSSPPDPVDDAPLCSIDGRLDWVDHAWDFLYTAETSGRPIDELACRFQLDLKRAEAIMKRARELYALKTGNGAHRHKMENWVPDRRAPEQKKILTCPRRPLQGPDKAIMKKYSSPLRQLADTNPALVQSALRLCAQRLWPREDLVLFHHAEKDPLQAKIYLEFLISLGMSRNDIWLVSYDRGDRSRWRARWKKEIDPNQYHHFEKRNAPNKASEAARCWLGIAPQFRLGPAANKDKNPGSLGFYFLLLMGQIVYGHI